MTKASNALKWRGDSFWLLKLICLPIFTIFFSNFTKATTFCKHIKLHFCYEMPKCFRTKPADSGKTLEGLVALNIYRSKVHKDRYKWFILFLEKYFIISPCLSTVSIFILFCPSLWALWDKLPSLAALTA